MINFRQFFLNESPDRIIIDSEELVVKANYTHPKAFAFGFIDTTVFYKGFQPLINLTEEEGKLVLLRAKTHGDLKWDWITKLNNGFDKSEDTFGEVRTYNLANPLDKQRFVKTDFWDEPNSRMILSPCGRVWNNIKNEINGEEVTVISLWSFRDVERNILKSSKIETSLSRKVEFTTEHLNRLLEKCGIPKTEESLSKVYLEFLEHSLSDDAEPRLKATDFYGNVKISSNNDQEEGIDDIIIGSHGNELNPNFGSRKESEKASKLKYPSVAQMKSERNPYGESVK